MSVAGALLEAIRPLVDIDDLWVMPAYDWNDVYARLKAIGDFWGREGPQVQEALKVIFGEDIPDIFATSLGAELWNFQMQAGGGYGEFPAFTEDDWKKLLEKAYKKYEGSNVQVPLPHQINPAVWQSLSPTAQKMILAAVKEGKTPSGVWDEADFLQQMAASWPKGDVPKTIGTSFQQPQSFF